MAEKIKLGEEQLHALQKMKNFIKSSDATAFSLVGSAGTGKSTIIKELLNWISDSRINYVLCAPTHKAGLVLRNITKKDDVITVHRLLSLTPNLEIFDLDFNALEFLVNKRKLRLPYKGVIIVDEASMINDDLFETIMNATKMFKSKIVFVGDKSQLQPVNARTTSKVFNLKDSFRLTKIYRQSDENGLLPILQELRTSTISHFNDCIAPEGSLYCFSNTTDFIRKAYAVYKKAVEDKNILGAKILAYTNKRVNAYNMCMKKLLFNNENEYNNGEFLTAYENISGGVPLYNSMDYIIVKEPEKIDINIGNINFNFPGYNLYLYDSFSKQTGCVPILSRDIDPEYFKMLAKYIEDIRITAIKLKKAGKISEANKRWVEYFDVMGSFTTPVNLVLDGRLIRSKSLGYGYATTVHKSQGSTLDEVFIDMKNIGVCSNSAEKRQLQYVALSRTKSNAFILQ